MNAVAGDNPEARTVTEVIRPQPKQAAQPGPVGVGHGEGGGKNRLASLIQHFCLPENYSHKRRKGCCFLRTVRLPLYLASDRNARITAGPTDTNKKGSNTNTTRGGTILMVVLAACSSARCRRSVRRESECTRSACATLVPKRSV